MPSDALQEGGWLSDIAETYALVGETERAVEILRQVTNGSRMPLFLSLDVRWDGIRDDPGFQELAERERAAWDVNR